MLDLSQDCPFCAVAEGVSPCWAYLNPAAPNGDVLIDGQSPGPAHGVDVDYEGGGTVTEQRMYQLIRQPKPIADRHFEIEFLDSGVEAFVFTFG